MTSSWRRAYQVCSKSSCHNWIWQDKIQSGNCCRKCGTWWVINKSNGKGKGQGHSNKTNTASMTWPRKTYQEALMDSPPGLARPRPLRRSKDQQQAAELLTATWDVIPDRHPQDPHDLSPSGGSSCCHQVDGTHTSNGKGDCTTAEATGHRVEEPVHQKESAPSEAWSSEEPICCHAPRYAGYPDKAQ